MKLVRFSTKRGMRIGVVIDDKIVDLISAFQFYQNEINASVCLPKSLDMIQLLELGTDGIKAAEQVLDCVKHALAKGGLTEAEIGSSIHEAPNVRLTAPVSNPRKIICIGLNYMDHAREAGLQPKEVPILFSKPSTAIIGPEEPILYPRMSKQVDFEVELGIIIGKRGKSVSIKDAYKFIAGYTVFNDVSARDLQFRDGQWFRAKSFDTFAPIGPCLATQSEVSNPNDLRLWLKVNGEVRQDSSTKNMIFDVPYLISFVSEVMTIEPGDIIATGTPAGVGIHSQPEPKLLEPGDLVEAYVEKIGILRNPVLSASR